MSSAAASADHGGGFLFCFGGQDQKAVISPSVDVVPRVLSPAVASSSASPSAGSERVRTGSAGQTQLATDERRRRRMVSNRESARRSRMRKQRHLEDLRLTVSRLQAENREAGSRLGEVGRQIVVLRRQNEGLRTESSSLRRRLLDIRQVLLFRQLQRVVTSTTSSSAAAMAANLCPNVVAAGFASS